MLHGVGLLCFFFFQAEDGIRDDLVTGVQTCALPICPRPLGKRTGRTHAADQSPGVEPSGEPGKAVELREEVAAVVPSQRSDRSEERRVGKECRCRWALDD